MADYTYGTGSGGIMLIRDQGSAVEFHIQAGSSSTYIGSPGYGAQAYTDGAWRPLDNIANYSNRVWRYLGAYTVSYNQDICFHIDATGTQGLGGPTDFWQSISRATVPGTPFPVSLDQIGHTTIRFIFSGTTDGGSPIREWQIGYGTDPNNVQYTVGSSGTSVIGGLSIGTTWYFWARGRNDVGWSNWSSRASARTLSSGRVKVLGAWREMILYVKVSDTWRQAILYEKKNGSWAALTGNPVN